MTIIHWSGINCGKLLNQQGDIKKILLTDVIL